MTEAEYLLNKKKEEDYVLRPGFVPSENMDYEVINRVLEPIDYSKMPKIGTPEYNKDFYDFFKKLNEAKGRAFHCRPMPDSEVKIYGKRKNSYY